jgi:hypothetical protein
MSALSAEPEQPTDAYRVTCERAGRIVFSTTITAATSPKDALDQAIALRDRQTPTLTSDPYRHPYRR